jgi:hypothetical protein
MILFLLYYYDNTKTNFCIMILFFSIYFSKGANLFIYYYV